MNSHPCSGVHAGRVLRSHDKASKRSGASRERSREKKLNSNVQCMKRRRITYEVPHQAKDEGHFHVVLGLDVDEDTRRYKIISYLGDGTFGKVILAWDRSRYEYCAIKIVRNIKKYTQDAEYEVSYMEKLQRIDPRGDFGFVRYHSSFLKPSGHFCIVMSHHGPNLLKLIQMRLFFNRNVLAHIAYQLCRSLHFLHRTVRCVHTDLKPENILVADPRADVRMLCPTGRLTIDAHTTQNLLSLTKMDNCQEKAHMTGLSAFPGDKPTLDAIPKQAKGTSNRSSSSAAGTSGGNSGDPGVCHANDATKGSTDKYTSTHAGCKFDERALHELAHPNRLQAISVPKDCPQPHQLDIRICDLGGCTEEKSEGRRSTIQTRHYRAPEVVLQTGWKCSADMWSVGCILYELYTGHMLYPTHDNYEHLVLMQHHHGPFPVEMRRKVHPDYDSWFRSDGTLIFPPISSSWSNVSTRKIQELLNKERPISDVLGSETEFLNFLNGFLQHDPQKRMTASEGMTHPFIQKYMIRP